MINQRLVRTVVALLAGTFAIRAQSAEFFGLGDFPEGEFLSVAQSISADGTTIVGSGSRFTSFGTSDAMRWRQDTGIVNLETLPQVDPRSTFGRGVSGNGDIAVGTIRFSGSPKTSEAFRWSVANGIVSLGYLPGAPQFHSNAQAISSDGQVIVGNSNSINGPNEAFRWMADSGMVGLGDLPGGDFSSLAYGVSADGKIVVGSATSDQGNEAFRWTAETGMVALNDHTGGFSSSTAYGISSDGTAIVGHGFSTASGTTVEAFRWTQEHGMQPLGDLPGGYYLSEAVGVSGDGSVVVGVSDRDDGGKAFVWDELHGMRDLQEVLVSEFALQPQLAGWSLTIANDISDDGLSIVGTGVNPDGNTEAWLVRLDRPITAPEPGTATLLLVAVIGWFAMTKRGGAQPPTSTTNSWPPLDFPDS